LDFNVFYVKCRKNGKNKKSSGTLHTKKASRLDLPLVFADVYKFLRCFGGELNRIDE
jgi:hypothetical protein